MRRAPAPSLLLAVFLAGVLAAAPALAQQPPARPPASASDKEADAEAIRTFKAATDKFREDDPQVPLKLAHEAFLKARRFEVVLNCLLLIGRIHQAKTGRLDLANAAFETIIRNTIGVKGNLLRKIKAEAFVEQGTLVYVQKGKVTDALGKYRAAHENYPSARSADVISQFVYREGREPGQSADARKKKLESALKLAHEAQKRHEKDAAREPDLAAKYLLQEIIVLMALDRKADADKVKEKLNPANLAENSLYQQAVLQVLQGVEAPAVAKTLGQFMRTRPTARARNQLRKFIRSEVDFKPYLERKSWEELLTDEKEGSEGADWAIPVRDIPPRPLEPVDDPEVDPTSPDGRPGGVASKTQAPPAPPPLQGGTGQIGPAPKAAPEDDSHRWRYAVLGLAGLVLIATVAARLKLRG